MSARRPSLYAPPDWRIEHRARRPSHQAVRVWQPVLRLRQPSRWRLRVAEGVLVLAGCVSAALLAGGLYGLVRLVGLVLDWAARQLTGGLG